MLSRVNINKHNEGRHVLRRSPWQPLKGITTSGQVTIIHISVWYTYVSFINTRSSTELQWRHNGRDGVLDHQLHDCLLNRLFGRRSKKISKLRATGLCAGNSLVTGEFPAQRVSNAENVSIWWRHHDYCSLLFKWPPEPQRHVAWRSLLGLLSWWRLIPVKYLWFIGRSVTRRWHGLQ